MRDARASVEKTRGLCVESVVLPGQGLAPGSVRGARARGHALPHGALPIAPSPNCPNQAIATILQALRDDGPLTVKVARGDSSHVENELEGKSLPTDLAPVPPRHTCPPCATVAAGSGLAHPAGG